MSFPSLFHYSVALFIHEVSIFHCDTETGTHQIPQKSSRQKLQLLLFGCFLHVKLHIMDAFTSCSKVFIFLQGILVVYC